MVKRFNRTIENQLADFVKANQRDWDERVPFLLMTYRTASQECTGFSPSRLMMGHELRTPIDLIYGRPPQEVSNHTEFANNLSESHEIAHGFAREHLKTASLRMKRKYDIRAEATALEVGDAVWLYNPQRKKRISPKLSRPWTGLFHIIKKINDLVYRIQLGARGKPKVVHRNRVRKYEGWVRHSQTTESHSEHVEISAPTILVDGGNGKGPELRRSKRTSDPQKDMVYRTIIRDI